MRIGMMIVPIVVLTLLGGIGAAQGADAPDNGIGHTPPRLSLTTGEVSFWRAGAQDWSRARVNTPLAPGDLLYTGPQGNLEIQIGSRAFVRGGPETQLGLENHEPDFLEFKVTSGNASFDLRTIEPGRTVEVDTPHGVFTIEQDGYYRVHVNGDRTSFITRSGGQATITYPDGETTAIGPNQELVIEGVERPQVASYAAPQLDEWDRWNDARSDHLLEAVSARYVSPGIYGVEDLDRYGTWRIVPTYNAVWVPRGVPEGWAPYSTGSWVMDPYYGWTWIDTAPWGWAPYHYGRWVFVSGCWAWAPGPVVVRPPYAPALVAFFRGPRVNIGISVGTGSVVGWVSLGWGEPCVPWWGPPSFRHRPWWGGWGGPHVVNNTVIHKTTVVNVHEVNVYRNARARNGVVVVSEDHFGRGPITSARVIRADGKHFKPVHRELRVRATPASFTPGEKGGIRPPRKVLDRSVVAKRPPRFRADSGSGKERKAQPALVPPPVQRIVGAPRQRDRVPEPRRLNRSRNEVDEVERLGTDRARPPALSKTDRSQAGKKAAGDPQASQERPGSQMIRPSPAKVQPAGSRAKSDPAKAPPASLGAQAPEIRGRQSGSVRSTTPQTPRQSQGDEQAVRSHPARVQPSVPRGEGIKEPKRFARETEPRQVGRQAREGAPSVSRQLPQQRRESQAAGPSRVRSQPSVRKDEARTPQGPERLQKPGQAPSKGTPQKAPKGRRNEGKGGPHQGFDT